MAYVVIDDGAVTFRESTIMPDAVFWQPTYQDLASAFQHRYTFYLQNPIWIPFYGAGSNSIMYFDYGSTDWEGYLRTARAMIPVIFSQIYAIIQSMQDDDVWCDADATEGDHAYTGPKLDFINWFDPEEWEPFVYDTTHWPQIIADLRDVLEHLRYKWVLESSTYWAKLIYMQYDSTRLVGGSAESIKYTLFSGPCNRPLAPPSGTWEHYIPAYPTYVSDLWPWDELFVWPGHVHTCPWPASVVASGSATAPVVHTHYSTGSGYLSLLIRAERFTGGSAWNMVPAYQAQGPVIRLPWNWDTCPPHFHSTDIPPVDEYPNGLLVAPGSASDNPYIHYDKGAGCIRLLLGTGLFLDDGTHVNVNVKVRATGTVTRSVDLNINGGAITYGEFHTDVVAYGKTDLLDSGATIVAAAYDDDIVFETDIEIDIPIADLYYAFDFATDAENTQSYWFPAMSGPVTFTHSGWDYGNWNRPTGYTAAALNSAINGVTLICEITLTPITP